MTTHSLEISTPTDREMAMGGVFREIVPVERIVCTERFDEPWYAGEAVNTSILSEKNGITTLSMTSRFESKEIRDGVLRSGMSSGVEASFDRLAEVLRSMPASSRLTAHAKHDSSSERR